jgi:hypothetical protein
VEKSVRNQIEKGIKNTVQCTRNYRLHTISNSGKGRISNSEAARLKKCAIFSLYKIVIFRLFDGPGYICSAADSSWQVYHGEMDHILFLELYYSKKDIKIAIFIGYLLVILQRSWWGHD